MRFNKKFITIMFIFLILFVGGVLYVFLRTGNEPGVLIGCVFTLCGFEAGILGKMKIDERKKKDGDDVSEYQTETRE